MLAAIFDPYFGFAAHKADCCCFQSDPDPDTPSVVACSIFLVVIVVEVAAVVVEPIVVDWSRDTAADVAVLGWFVVEPSGIPETLLG